MADVNDVINGAKNAGKAMDKATEIKETAEKAGKFVETVTDPNARTSDKLGDATDAATSYINQYLPDPVEIPDEGVENMREFYGRTEDAMD